MRILFLCQRGGLDREHRERQGIAVGLARLGAEVITLPEDQPTRTQLKDVMRIVGPLDAVLSVEWPGAWLPDDIHAAEVTTGCFQIDTYAWPMRRVRWSLLFDVVFVFHPGFEQLFSNAGNHQVNLLGHASWPVERMRPHINRPFDVGWVGQAGGPDYHRRLSILKELELNGAIAMNDWRRRYDPSEVVGLYEQARVVVNIGHDWWPGDANLRCFEAIAAGSLLVTYVPSELSLFGFEEGTHFVGFRHETEVLPLVRKYLDDEAKRERIAAAGWHKLADGHTWTDRASNLLNALSGAQRVASARTMAPRELLGIYLDYYVAHRDWQDSLRVAHRLGLRHPGSLLEETGKLLGRRLHRARV